MFWSVRPWLLIPPPPTTMCGSSRPRDSGFVTRVSAFCQRVSHVLELCRKQEAPSVRGRPSDSTGDDHPAVPVPVIWWGHGPGQLPPLLPLPWLAWSRAGLDFVLSPLEAARPDSVGAKFLFIFPGFFGVGRLRNVECCNFGRGVEKRDPALLSRSSFSPLRPRRLLAPLGSPVPSPSRPQYHVVSLQLRGPGPDHTASLGCSCGFQLFEAAVVASSKVAVDQQQMKPEGLFIAGWPRGLEQGLGPGAVQRLLIRDQ